LKALSRKILKNFALIRHFKGKEKIDMKVSWLQLVMPKQSSVNLIMHYSCIGFLQKNAIGSSSIPRELSYQNY